MLVGEGVGGEGAGGEGGVGGEGGEVVDLPCWQVERVEGGGRQVVLIMIWGLRLDLKVRRR